MWIRWECSEPKGVRSNNQEFQRRRKSLRPSWPSEQAPAVLPPACLPALQGWAPRPCCDPQTMALLELNATRCPALIWHSSTQVLLREGSHHMTIFLCRQDKVLLNIAYSSEICCTKEGKDTNCSAAQRHRYPTVPFSGLREILQARH